MSGRKRGLTPNINNMRDDIFGGDLYSILNEQDVWREDNLLCGLSIGQDERSLGHKLFAIF